MDSAIVVALIGVAGTLGVAVLNHLLQRRVADQGERIANQNERLANQNQRIADQERIDEYYVQSMSDDCFRHLQKLATGRYGPYWVDPDMRYGLGPELNHLKHLGFIRFDVDPNVEDIREMPKGDQPELSRYISVTEPGRDFIRRRLANEARRNDAR